MSWLRKTIVTLLFFVLLGAVVSFFSISITYATGDSMEPTIHKGDGFVTVEPNNIKTGDIIKFYSPKTNKFVTHRVVGENEQGFITKGDNVQNTDQKGPFRPVKKKQVRGKVVEFNGEPITFPYMGVVGPIIINNKFFILSIFLFIIILGDINSSSSRGRKIEYLYESIAPLFTICVISLTILIILQTSVLPYNIVYTDGPNPDSKQNLIPIGSDKNPVVDISLGENSFSHTIIDSSGRYKLKKVKFLDSKVRVTLDSPVRQKPGVVRGKLSVHNYPAILPREIILALHELHFVIAAFVSSICVLFIPFVIFTILQDPFKVRRETRRGEKR